LFEHTFTFGKKLKTILQIESFRVHTHSFIFVPVFPLRGVAAAADLGRPEIPHDQQQYQKVPSVHTKAGPRKVGDVVTPPGLWTSRLLSRECSQQDLPHQSSLGDTWPNQRSWDFSIRRSVVDFPVVDEFQTCALCHEVHTLNSSQKSHLWRLFL